MAQLSSNKFEEWEITKYWEIFSGLNPQNGLLSGDRAAPVLKNSKLNDTQLEKIWDLADVDNDGNLDFEEFCIAMRIIFDLINQNLRDVPKTLPDWLIPASKSHLIQANQALKTGTSGLGQVDDDDDDDDVPNGLSSDFDWYMSPSDKATYDSVFTANCDRSGQVSFDSMAELYGTLNVPETDLRSAWNLVNPRSDRAIGKDQALAFLHILNNRDKGVRVPRNIPASLRATFERSEIDYDLTTAQPARARFADPPTTKKSAFADSYLTRLGISSSKTSYSPAGTDFSATKDTDWEEVRLKRQLADVEEQLERAEAAARRRRDKTGRDSKSSLVRHEYELMYEYKLREVQKTRNGETGGRRKVNVESIRGDLDVLKQQIDAFEGFANQKQAELNRLYQEIEREKSS
ncbi:actin cytoskeleton-regulatory complex protein END3-domain-containing protein [Dipodascopsis tothii]|uniref:actin cytoskeleton-regulatory complex protein END3-domain-containing protein n=1 Tax=Dipodascopsis tothii TaxID=44089 RepID=UPI0034CDD889